MAHRAEQGRDRGSDTLDKRDDGIAQDDAVADLLNDPHRIARSVYGVA